MSEREKNHDNAANYAGSPKDRNIKTITWYKGDIKEDNDHLNW